MAKKEKKTTSKASLFTKGELQAIKKKLVNEKVKIIGELLKLKGEDINKSFKDASGDLSGYTFHMADMATDLYDREFTLGLAEGERERLYALDQAIKRIDGNSYGRCDSCGGKISRQRIKVMPQAEYCIKCQEKEERFTEK